MLLSKGIDRNKWSSGSNKHPVGAATSFGASCDDGEPRCCEVGLDRTKFEGAGTGVNASTSHRAKIFIPPSKDNNCKKTLGQDIVDKQD